MSDQDLVNFIFEMGQLKRIKHEGWRLIGVENPETVGVHSLRAAQIAFILAKMENYSNPHEVCSMLVFHDIGECRIGDLHKVASRYVQSDEALAVKEQTEKLAELGQEILRLWTEVEDKSTEAGIIAKDADYLEQAVTAKEYLEKGYEFAEDWLKNISKALRTKSAKNLLEVVKKTHSNVWWQGLKKLS